MDGGGGCTYYRFQAHGSLTKCPIAHSLRRRGSKSERKQRGATTQRWPCLKRNVEGTWGRIGLTMQEASSTGCTLCCAAVLGPQIAHILPAVAFVEPFSALGSPPLNVREEERIVSHHRTTVSPKGRVACCCHRRRSSSACGRLPPMLGVAAGAACLASSAASANSSASSSICCSCCCQPQRHVRAPAGAATAAAAAAIAISGM